MSLARRPFSCKAVPLTGSRDCFATLPQSVIDKLRGEVNEYSSQQIVVIEIESTNGSQYVSWGRGVQPKNNEESDCIGIPVQLMSLFGIEKNTQVSIKIHTDLHKAKEVYVEPASIDDSEIVEHNAALLEELILRQLRVAYNGLVCPIFVRQGLTVHLKVTKIEQDENPSPRQKGKPPVVLLGEGTELMVATQMRKKPAQQEPVRATFRIGKVVVHSETTTILKIHKHACRDLKGGTTYPAALHSSMADAIIDKQLKTKSVTQQGDEDDTVGISDSVLRKLSFTVQLARSSEVSENFCEILVPNNTVNNVTVGSLLLLDSTLPCVAESPPPIESQLECNSLPEGSTSSIHKPAWDSATAHFSGLLNSDITSLIYKSKVESSATSGSCYSLLVAGGEGYGKTHFLGRLREQLTSKSIFCLGYSPTSCIGKVEKKEEKTHLQRAFMQAAANAPAVLFIDDVDVMVKYDPESHGADSQVLSSFLSLWTSASNSQNLVLGGLIPSHLCTSGVTVVASCKDPESLHPKMSKLFSSVVRLTLPTPTERKRILKQVFKSGGCQPVPGLLSKAGRDSNNYTVRDVKVLGEKIIFESKTGHVETGKLIQITDYEKAIENYKPASLAGIQLHEKDDSLSWDSVGGMEEVKRVFNETIILPTKYPELYQNIPIKMRSGIMLYGPTGCGKSHVVQCAVAEAGLNCIQVSGPELLNKYIGQSEQKVREVFEKAQAAAPCILFFDEFDSVAPQRGHDNTGVTDRVVNQLLCHLDGAEGRSGVYVVAATARPDLIDKALLRPGRLDVSSYCGMPDHTERVDIFKAASRNISLSDTADFSELASKTEGYTGADIAAVLSTARLSCIQKVVDTTTQLASMNIDTVDEKTAHAGVEHTWSLLQGSAAVKQQDIQEDDLDDHLVSLGICKIKTADVSANTSSVAVPSLTQDDLIAALAETHPSISPFDVVKNNSRYENYRDARASPSSPKQGQRTTLA